MPMLKHYGVGTIPWGPIAAGREFSLVTIADNQSCVDHTKTWTLQPEEQAESKMAEASFPPTRRSSILSNKSHPKGAYQWQKSLLLGRLVRSG